MFFMATGHVQRGQTTSQKTFSTVVLSPLTPAHHTSRKRRHHTGEAVGKHQHARAVQERDMVNSDIDSCSDTRRATNSYLTDELDLHLPAPKTLPWGSQGNSKQHTAWDNGGTLHWPGWMTPNIPGQYAPCFPGLGSENLRNQ